MIKIEVKGLEGLQKAGQKFLAVRPRVPEEIDRRMRLFGEALATRAKTKYLSGRPGLNVITGRLRSSISYAVSGDSKEKVLKFGTNVVYAPIHEFGGTISTRHASIRIPKRSFLRPSFEEESPAFVSGLKQGLRAVIAEGTR